MKNENFTIKIATEASTSRTTNDSNVLRQSVGSYIAGYIMVLLLVMTSVMTQAATILVTTNTNWSALTGGTGPGGLPSSNDTVRVRAGATLTVNVNNAVCRLISAGVGGGNNLTSTISFNNASVLTTTRFILGGPGTRKGSLNMSAGGLLQVSGTVNVTNLGTFTAGTGTIAYTGTGNQTIVSELIPAYNNLTMSGSSFKSLGGDVTVNGTFTISNGRLNIGNRIFTIGASGSISIASPSQANMIIASGGGEVRKVFTADAVFDYPVGDNTNGNNSYSPFSLTVRGTAYSSAYVSVRVTEAKHPDNASTPNFITRYWTVTQNGITSCNVDVTARYVNTDITGTENQIRCGQLNGTFDQLTNGWIRHSQVNAPNNLMPATNADMFDGVATAFTGITRSAPTVLISGGNVNVCPNAPVQLSTAVTGDPVFAYSWTPTTDLSSSTVSNPIASPSVTTVYTVVAYDGNGITASDSTTITIDSGVLAGQPGGISGSQLVCDGALGVAYSVPPAPNALTYDWTAPAGATIASGAGTLSITVDFPTPFTTDSICVTANNACNSPSAPRCTTLYNINAFTPNTIVGPPGVCTNATGIQYHVQEVDGAGTYDWTVPAGITIASGQGTSEITVDIGPAFVSGDICVTITNSCGTSLPSCTNVTSTNGVVPGGITGIDSVCANDAGLAYFINPINGVIDYTWSVPAGFTIVSGQSTTSITVDAGATPTAGDICVVANYTCGSSLPQCLAISIIGTDVGFISGPSSVCEGTLGVAYSVDTVPGAISYNWILPPFMTLASGGTSNAITVDVGIGYVTADICVTVTTACGTGSAQCRTINATSPNQPGPISGPVVICPGTNDVMYEIASVPGAVSYIWTGAAGMTITAGNTRFPLVDFDGGFVSGDLCVVSVSACGSQSQPVCITVYDINNFTPPVIDGPAFVCSNTTNIEYSIPEIPGTDDYNWVLPAGITFSAGTVSDTNVVFVDIDGAFLNGDICVNISNSCGTSLDRCLNVTAVSTAPGMPGGISGDVVVCAGTNNLQYSVQPLAGVTDYTWSVPAGMTLVTGQGTNIVTIDIGAGYTTGSICVFATACGLSGPQRCLTVTLNTQSVPPNINGPGTFCINDVNVEFRISTVDGATSYSWLLPNGITHSAGTIIDSNVVFVDIGPGFTIGDICVATNASCGISNYRCKAIKEIEYVTPGGITGPEIVCPNTSGIQYSIQPYSGAVAYEWFVPPGVTIVSGDTTRIITVDFGPSFTTGDFGVRAIASCGNKSMIRWNTTTTSVNPALPGFIEVSGAACPGSTVSFTVDAIEGADAYTWTLPAGMSVTGGTPTDSNSVSVDVAPGFIQGDVCVQAVSACGIGGYQRCKTININPATPGTISGPVGVCANATGLVYSIIEVDFADTYEWGLPAGWNITSGSGTNSITVDAGATFFQGQIFVIAVSSCGNKSARRYLNISANPANPSAISGPFAPCPGNVVVYTINAVNGADAYTWTLPAGMTVTNGTPADENSISLDVDNNFAGGDICVKAITTCGGQSANSCLTLGITPEAPAEITGDPTVCAGTSSLIYSVEPINGVTSFTWTVPAGITLQSGQGFNSIVVDIDPGFTSGQLCVTANSDCGSSTSTCLAIGLTPGSPSDITQSSNFCPGTAQTLSIEQVAGATIYNWVIPAGLTELYGQGTSSITVFVDPTYSPGQVCVTAETSCGATGTSYCETIQLSVPVIPANIIASSVVCAGSNVVFSATEVHAAGSFTWTVPSGMTILSGQNTASIEVSTDPGFTSGQVCVTANSACGISSSQKCVNFSTTPATPGTITSPPVICPNSTGNIISVPVQSGIANYNWTLPTGLTIADGDGSNAIVVDAGPGFISGQISVTAESFCGTVSTARNLNVNSLLPNPGVVVFSGPTCNNTTVTATIPLQTGATSYIWTPPAGITISAGQGTNSVTLDIGPSFTSGQLCVSGISVCGNPGTPRCPIIRSVPNQPGNISGTFNNVCGQTFAYSVGNASGATSYQWTAPTGSQVVSGQGTNSVSVSFDPGFISGQLEVVAVNSCGNSLPRLSALITCGPVQQGPRAMNPEVDGFSMLVYPVPASEYVTVEFLAGTGIKHQVQVFDINGKLISTKEVVSQLGLNRNSVVVSNLPKGVYLLQVQREDGYTDQNRIVVQ